MTLWGPTHLMLIGGAAMTLVGLAVLLVEAGAANDAAGRAASCTVGGLMRRVSLPGAFLLGLSTFQAEFDFGVPQFRMVFAPMLIMLAAGVALVAARIWLGRGAALGAALFFLAMRGLMALLVGPVLGEPTPHFPLYLVEALLVELIALFVRRPLPFALASGVGDRHRRPGRRVGLDARLDGRCRGRPRWRPRASCSGSRWRSRRRVVGAWLGARLSADRDAVVARAAPCVGAVAIFALVGFGLLSTGSQGVRGTVTLASAARPRAARPCASTRPTAPTTPSG